MRMRIEHSLLMNRDGNFMNKLIGKILVITLLFSTCSVYAQDDTFSTLNIFKNNFEDASIGGKPTSGTAEAKSNRMYVAENPVGDGKCLKFEAINESDFYYQYSLSTEGDNVVLEFDIMYENIESGSGTFLLCTKDLDNNEIRLLTIDKNRNLKNADGNIILNLTPNKFYKICLDLSLEDNNYDLYINQRLRGEKLQTVPREFSGISLLRYHMLEMYSGAKNSIYLDNVNTYEAPEPVFVYEEKTGKKAYHEKSSASVASVATDKELADYMGNAVALYVGKNKMLVNGEASYLDKNDKSVCVFTQDDRAFAPIRFLSDAFEYDVKWDENTQTCTLNNGASTVVVKKDSFDITVDGKISQMDTKPIVKNDRIYIPVRFICEAFGKKISYDKSGMIVISDKENFFDFKNDLGVFRAAAGKLVFDDLSGEKIVETIKNRFPQNSHPRLYFDKNGLDKIRNDVETNSIKKKWKDSIVKRADEFVSMKLLKYEIPDGIRLLQTSRDAKDRIEYLSMAYLLTNDEKYSNRAISEMINVCNFKDWNPYHFLDTAEMMQAVSVGYDWLYDVLSENDKKIIEDSLIKKGLEPVLEDYTDKKDRVRTWLWSNSVEPDNWNLVCNGGSVVTAIALSDVDEEKTAKVFDYGLKLAQKAVLMYAPDGAWYEGPGYWLYGTSYFINMIACMKVAIGDTLGYLDAPGIRDTGYYTTALSTSEGVFNFHDGASSRVNSPEQFFLSDELCEPALSKIRLNQMRENNINPGVRDIIWFNTDYTNSTINMNRDFYYRDTEVASMRSNWTEYSSIFLGVHAGKTNVYHGHMDAGQFIIDAFGTRYVFDLGPDDYNIPDSVWNLYRYRAEGHSTLVINPNKDGGQNILGSAIVNRFESTDSEALAVIDLTSMYLKDAKSVKRGYKLTNNRSSIVIQDEITNKIPTDVYWFMHTKCDIEVAEDKKSAIIRGDIKDMYIYLLDETKGEFSVMDAVPLPSSPVNEAQDKNYDFKKLCFVSKNVSNITIPIGIDFKFKDETDFELYHEDVVPIDKWELKNREYVSKPYATSIKVNGEKIEGFDRENLVYAYRTKFGEPIPEITAEGTGNVEIIMPDVVPGNAFIRIKDKADNKNVETYVVELKSEIMKEVPEGLNEIKIKSVCATLEPQAENCAINTIDNDLSTRWSANGHADLICDLGASYNVSHVGVAVYQDKTNDGRMQYFNIAVSEDGKNYKKVYSGNSSGTILDKEIFPFVPAKCRYVKLECNGTTVGEWNSITEIAVYTQDNI